MRRWRSTEPLAIDPVGTAGALSALAGVASIGWPYFEGMAAALAALASVGWLGGTLAQRAPWRRPLVVAVVVALVAGWGFFVLAPGPLGVFRGGVLGATAGLVGWVGRRRPAFGEGA
ncbi:MAG TPA: hypothetical protein VGS23_05560 [Thermoplasmata archaeon]|nr:hypothetical protein [Thermoplasmata archaeon]